MWLVILLVGALSILAEAWGAMLLIGAVHSEVPEVPTFSLTGAVWLVILVNMLMSFTLASQAKQQG